jgi:nucleoside-diphosphate-sugar epimerase
MNKTFEENIDLGLWLLQVHHEKYFYTEYERSKVAADKVASQAAAEGLPIVTLYPGVVYGPGKLTTGNALAKMVRSSTCSSYA